MNLRVSAFRNRAERMAMISRIQPMRADASAKLRQMRQEREEARNNKHSRAVVFQARQSALAFFPTPNPLAREVAEEADVSGLRVLEPEAGSGHLAMACREAGAADVVCVELYRPLADLLASKQFPVTCGDFLTIPPATLGTFDRVVMNPPFDRGADIQHVWHAMKFLKPGGRLVAIIAAGPRQREAFAEYAWRDLPEGSFSSQGTNVRTALITITQ